MTKNKGFRDGMKEELLDKIAADQLKKLSELDDNKKQTFLQMDDADWDRLSRQQKYFSLKDISLIRAKVLLESDEHRRHVFQAKLSIKETLHQIKDLLLAIERSKQELKSGKITSEIKDGITMTETELKHYIEKQKRLCWAFSQDIVPQLQTIQAYIGSSDIAKNVIISAEEFDEYVKETEKELAEMGYELFRV